MNRTLLSFVAACALLAAGVSSAVAQTVTSGNGKKLLPVATIQGAQEVQNFQRNVQVLQAERQAAADLQVAVEKEKNSTKKKELQTKLDAAAKRLNDDNATMAKTYGFTLTRNYELQFDSATILLEVTDEEAAKIEQAVKAQQAQKAKK